MVVTCWTPRPRTRVSMSMWVVGSPSLSVSTPGWGWWPVMAVVPLSRITRVKSWLLCTALTSPVMPEWKKVLSPMKLTTFLPVARLMPPELETLEPMQMRKSAIWMGGRSPRV